MDHLYIRHSVGGKLLFDSKQDDASFTVETVGQRWKIAVDTGKQSACELVVQFCNEMNIFVLGSENPPRKTWFYSRDGEVEYDRGNGRLVIWADSRIEYPV